MCIENEIDVVVALSENVHQLQCQVTGFDNAVHFFREWIEHSYSRELAEIRDFKKTIDLLRKEISTENKKLDELKRFSRRFEEIKKFTELKYNNLGSILERYIGTDVGLSSSEKLKKVKKTIKGKKNAVKKI